MPEEPHWSNEAVISALRDWARRYGQAPSAEDWDRARARRQGRTDRLARLDAHPSSVPGVSTVIRRFGTWKAAVSAAGLHPRSATRRLDTDRLRETVELYTNGLSTLEVAERLRLAPKTVRDRLHAADVALRPSRRWSDRRVLDADLEAAVVAASVAGATQPELQDRFALSRRQVGELLKRHEIAGGPLVRYIRAHKSELDEGELTARQRAVIELLVTQRLGHRQAAERLGISSSTLYADVRQIAQRLQQQGEPSP